MAATAEQFRKAPKLRIAPHVGGLRERFCGVFAVGLVFCCFVLSCFALSCFVLFFLVLFCFVFFVFFLFVGLCGCVSVLLCLFCFHLEDGNEMDLASPKLFCEALTKNVSYMGHCLLEHARSRWRRRKAARPQSKVNRN